MSKLIKYKKDICLVCNVFIGNTLWTCDNCWSKLRELDTLQYATYIPESQKYDYICAIILKYKKKGLLWLLYY